MGFFMVSQWDFRMLIALPSGKLTNIATWNVPFSRWMTMVLPETVLLSIFCEMFTRGSVVLAFWPGQNARIHPVVPSPPRYVFVTTPLKRFHRWMGPPNDSVQLVYKSYNVWVYDTQITIVHGVYKPNISYCPWRIRMYAMIMVTLTINIPHSC